MEMTMLSVLLGLIAAYLIIVAIVVVFDILAGLFLGFIIAEDAISRNSAHPIVWGVFTFLFSFTTIFVDQKAAGKKS